MTQLAHEPGQSGLRGSVLSCSVVNIAVLKDGSSGPIIRFP